jgi:phosphatidate cytidylyltransferase
LAAGELTRRWGVAAVGVPAVVGVLWAGGWVLAVVVAAVACLGAHECYRLAEHTGARAFVWLGLPAAGALVLGAEGSASASAFASLALIVLAALTLAALLGAAFVRGPEGRPLAAAALTIFGALYAGLSLATVPLLHALPLREGWGGETDTPWTSVAIVALPLAATWIGDAAAFFAGKAWGKRRLAPSISPKKSWAGAVAGVTGAAAGAAVWYLVTVDLLPAGPFRGIVEVALVGGVLGVAAILGDLVESALKRDAGVKDSGTLLPGHGGVLDRIDALTFSLPVSYAVLALMGTLR